MPSRRLQAAKRHYNRAVSETPVRIVRRDVVYAGPTFRVVRDLQELDDGTQLTWESVQHGAAVLALPIDARGTVYLLEQYRPQLARFPLEVIGGRLEDGEAPEDATRRELREEAGITARLVSLGEAELGVSTVVQHQHLFLAHVETLGESEPEDFERRTIRGLRTLTLGDAVGLAMSGGVTDTTSRALILMANEHLRRPSFRRP